MRLDARVVPGRRPLMLLAASIAAWTSCVGGDMTIRLSEGQIQRALDLRYPVERSYLDRLTVTFRNPVVSLETAADRLGMEVEAEVAFGDGEAPRTLSGAARIATGIGFDRGRHTILAVEPVV